MFFWIWSTLLTKMLPRDSVNAVAPISFAEYIIKNLRHLFNVSTDQPSPNRSVSISDTSFNNCLPYAARSSPSCTTLTMTCPISYLVITSARLTDRATLARASIINRSIRAAISATMLLSIFCILFMVVRDIFTY